MNHREIPHVLQNLLSRPIPNLLKPSGQDSNESIENTLEKGTLTLGNPSKVSFSALLETRSSATQSLKGKSSALSTMLGLNTHKTILKKTLTKKTSPNAPIPSKRKARISKNLLLKIKIQLLRREGTEIR